LSLAINYAISGYSVRSYHVFNLIIHIFAGLTLYGIIRRTLLGERLKNRFAENATAIAWVSAVIWLVHPVQTESVTYVVQRTESLMGLFYLLTLYAAIRAMQSSGNPLWPVVSVVCCSLGMGTKEVMVTAPTLVLLYDRAFFAGSFAAALRHRWRLYIALAATWIILAALLWSCPRQEQIEGFSIAKSLNYAMNQGVVIVHYLRLVVWPKGLCLDYFWPMVKNWGKLAAPELAVLWMAAVTVWGLIRNRLWPYPLAWFFGTLAVTSSFVPVKDLAFEHRMYLPLAGLVTLLVMSGYTAAEHLAKQFRIYRAHYIALMLAAGIIIALTCVTVNRNKDYRSVLSIWESVLKVSPDNARAHDNLGNVLQLQGRLDEAVAHYNKALQADANSAAIHNNLGNVLLQQEKLDKAISHFSEALRLNPNYADAHNNMGIALSFKGKSDEAISHYRRALQLRPSFSDAHNNLGIALQSLGRFDEALYHFRQTLQLKPDYLASLNGVAWILATGPDSDARDIKEAVALAERAAKLTGIPAHYSS
jgi:tetratricopeptide (TPR) repeat protein